jgi:predicted aldo/keto reductase-like oxidoreductase
MAREVSRRQFVRDTASRAAVVAAGVGVASAFNGPRIVRAGNPEQADTSKILNYSPDMEYRRCGKTGLMLSAACLGGHWKRLVNIIGGKEPRGWMTSDIDREDFQKNRYEVVTRCIERGINYVDACCREEILAYSRAVRGRRDQMFFGYSWHIKESRFEEWRSAQRLKQGLDEGMREAGLDYVDLWRISLLVDSHQHSQAELDAVAEALDWAKQSGRARFTGVSSHDRPHLKKIIETYPEHMDAILTPYTANTKLVTDESGLWATIKKHDVGWLGIKPFASNSVFKGDSSPDSPHFKEDNRMARLCIRYILCNDAITAPMPGMISTQQVDNVALAVKERRVLDLREQAELRQAMDHAFAHLPRNYQWLRNWEYV